MNETLAIDPGCTESAWVHLNAGGMPLRFGKEPNRIVLERIGYMAAKAASLELVIESVACYGMKVGFEVFETCVWTGRFVERWEETARNVANRLRVANRLYRQDVKLHLCGQTRAKDGNVRQALIDRFGGSAAKGTKARPGPCYGMSGDVWAALAVACAWRDGVRSKIKGAA